MKNLTIILLIAISVINVKAQDSLVVKKFISDNVYLLDGDSIIGSNFVYDEWIDSVSADTAFRTQFAISDSLYEIKRVILYKINGDTLIRHTYKSRKKEKKNKKPKKVKTKSKKL